MIRRVGEGGGVDVNRVLLRFGEVNCETSFEIFG